MRTPTTIIALAAALAVPAAPAVAAPAGPGGLATAPSCAVQCIVSGVATPSTSGARVVVKTSVRTRLTLTVRKVGAGGKVGAPLIRRRVVVPRRTHRLRLRGLAAGVDYRVTIRATDQNGRSKVRTGTFRTRAIEPVGFGASSALAGDTGCLTQCILSATSSPDLTGTRLDIRTSTEATIEIEADPSVPQMVGGSPYHIGGAERMVTLPTDDKRVVFRLGALQSGTLYHVILRATDEHGNVAWRTGTIRTLKRRVELRFTHVELIADGDNGSSNRGEIVMAAGAEGQAAFGSPCTKRKGGTWFEPPANGLVFPDHGKVLSLHAYGYDWDEPGIDHCHHALFEVDEDTALMTGPFGTASAPHYDGSIEYAVAAGTLDLDQLMDGAQSLVTGVELAQTDPDARVRYRILGELRVTATP